MKQSISSRKYGPLMWEERPTQYGDFAHHYIYTPINLVADYPAYTAIILLKKDTDVILGGFDKETKYEIRRAEKEEFSYYMNEYPSEMDVEDFLMTYAEFVESKGLNPTEIAFYRDELCKRREENSLCISKIVSEEGILIYHVYSVETPERIRLTCSASVYREFSSSVKAKNGRLNRLQHWKDIQFFKERGYKIYDLGGTCLDVNNKDLYSVSKFKFAFSTLIEKRYIVSRRNAHIMESQNKKVILKGCGHSLWDGLANELVNQLSDEYCFVIENGVLENASSCEYVIEVDKIRKERWGINPLVNFYSNIRTGEIKYAANFKAENIELFGKEYGEKISYIDMDTSNDEFNKIDICIFRIDEECIWMKVLEAMAAGCIPVIIVENSYDLSEMEDITEYGIVIKESVFDKTYILGLFKEIETKADQIRAREKGVAEYIYKEKRWEIMSENIKKEYLK